MSRGWVGKWLGGRIWEGADGARTYVIRRKINGKPYNVSTRCTSERAALAQLERFEADPEGYDPSGGQADPLVLDLELATAFLKWSKGEKGNSAEWVGKQKRYLMWWAKVLGGRDLRRVTLRDHIRPALDTAANPRQRIEVIKALFAWLRKNRHRITTAEDPTYGALAVPQGRPEQWVTSKVIPREHHEKALRHIAPAWGDRIVVLSGTGWHVTELIRFARSGVIAALPGAARRDHGAVAVLVCPQRKSGEMMRTPVSAEVEAAARRVRERGGFSKIRLYRALAGACEAAGVPPYSPGQYRHTVATWAVEAGADPAAVAAFLGHKSVSTTRRFYSTLAVVPKVPTLT